MRLAVIGDVEQGIHELMHYGASVGFDMIHAKDGLPHEVAETVHAVVYVVKGAIADVHDKIQSLATSMQRHGIRRLVVHATDPGQQILGATGLDWTVVSDEAGGRYDHEFAKFVIGQVTDSRNVNTCITRSISE